MSQESTAKVGSFRDIFSQVLEDRNKDPLLHLLVLTYEFDEQQLRNLVCCRNLEEDYEIKQSQLEIVSKLRPLVIYDARKTKEAGTLPPFLELHPYQSGGFACHHSKAYLFITEKTVRLVLGSFNLTETGLFKNREVFQSFLWDSPQSDDLHLLPQWVKFLTDHYASRLVESSQSTLTTILKTLRERIATWSAQSSQMGAQLLYSGYGQTPSGLQSLQEIWKNNFPNKEPDTFVAVSPFFDENPQEKNFASELQVFFPSLVNQTIITDEAVVDHLSKAHFGTNWSSCNNELLAIPATLSEQERARIEKASNLPGAKSKDLQISRKLHAKVLMLQKDEQALVVMGSANFTCKAWLGASANQELGLVWKQEDPMAFKKSLLEGLGGTPYNRFDALPETATSKIATLDDEGYTDQTGFPGFIEHILLIPSEDRNNVRFQIEIGNTRDENQTGNLSEYEIEWAGLKLVCEPHLSQWIDQKDYQSRILGARHLSFRPKLDLTRIFYFPFQYTGTLITEPNTYLHPSSWDWMAFYLNPNQNSPLGDHEKLPGEEDGTSTVNFDNSCGVDRAGNCVIAMQAYLNVFGRIESDFTSRAIGLEKMDKAHRLEALRHQILDPLMVFCRILEREAASQKKSEDAPDIVFKLGELLMFLSTLGARESLRDYQEKFEVKKNLVRDMLSRRQGQESLLKSYVSFILEQSK